METKESLEELKKKNDLYYDSLDLSKVNLDNFLIFFVFGMVGMQEYFRD